MPAPPRPSPDNPPPDGFVRGPVLRWAELFAAVVLAGIVLVLFQNPTQHIDELYHVLAAKSLLADGDLLIGDTGRPYTRAKGYTYAVAASFKVFGAGLWQSRLPSLLAGLVLAGVVFGWSRWRFGRAAAWVGLVLLLQMPIVVYLAEVCRFYMVQAAAAMLLLAMVDAAIDPALGRVRRLGAIALGVLATGVAMHVQVSSVFPVAVALSGAAVALYWRRPLPALGSPRRRVVVLAALLLCLALTLLVTVNVSAPVREQWDRYRLTVPWAAESRDDALFYVKYLWFWHRWLVVLWVPAFVLACVRWRWRAVWVGAFFLVGLAAHSFGGMKAPRYLLWALPCFTLTLGMGVSSLVWLLTRRPPTRVGQPEGAATSPQAGPPAFAPLPFRVFVWVGVLLILAFALSRTLGPYQVRSMVTGGEHPFVFPDWPGVRGALERDSAWQGGVVVASADVKALDALGRCDYSLSRSRSEGRDPFEMDWRTGLPVVYTASSLAQVVEDHPAGLVVVEEGHWRRAWGVSVGIADWLESNLERVEVDPATKLRVYRWDRRPEPPPTDADPAG